MDPNDQDKKGFTNERMSSTVKIIGVGVVVFLILGAFLGIANSGSSTKAGGDAEIQPEDTSSVKSAYDRGEEAAMHLRPSAPDNSAAVKEILKDPDASDQDQGDKPAADASGEKEEPVQGKDGKELHKDDLPEMLGGPRQPAPAMNDSPRGSGEKTPAEQAREQMLQQISSSHSEMFRSAVTSKIMVQGTSDLKGGSQSRGFDANDPQSLAAEQQRANSELQQANAALAQGPAPQQSDFGGSGYQQGPDMIGGGVPDPNGGYGGMGIGGPRGMGAQGARAFAGLQSDGWALGNEVQAPATKYEIRAGMVIPATLISGANSDTPGQLVAQVSQNVYDTATGKYLMIPQGTRLVGAYASGVAYGQERLMCAWQRLIFPDGRTLDIGAMPGADSAGFSGFNDQVNNHWFKMLGAAFLMSGITAAVSVSVDNSSSSTTNSTNMSDTMRESLATQFGTVIENVIQKNLNISPTLEIRPGYRFNVIVTKDLIFKKPYKLFNY